MDILNGYLSSKLKIFAGAGNQCPFHRLAGDVAALIPKNVGASDR